MEQKTFRDYFEEYSKEPSTNWIAKYRARCEQIDTIRKQGESALDENVLRELWQKKSNGIADVGRGVMSAKEFDAVKDQLPAITLQIINEPTPEVLDEVIQWVNKEKSTGHLKRGVWAVINRVFSAAAPELYSSIADGNDLGNLIDKLNEQFALRIPQEGNWARKNAAMMAAIKESELKDEDIYLLNTFVWHLVENLRDTQGIRELQKRIYNDLELPGSMDAPRNVIYYGPPGTGKTYQLNKLKAQYVSSQQSLSREAWLTQQLLEARWFDVTVAALYQLGGKAKAKAIVEHEFLQLKARAQGRTQNVQNQVWATLQTHTIETSTTVNYTNRLSPQVFDKSPESEWYLVDDWLESCEEQRQMAEAWQAGPPTERTQERYAFVTFHQAYSYEDFIEGIRPIHDPETGEVGYKVLPGVFRRICQQAKADPQNRYAIFIDEINRGNIAKIFGELITLVEQDKRAAYSEDGKFMGTGMEVTLPYSGERFGVPQNLDIYGAMNTADRSIALLDTALRRRFRFQELMPNPNYIAGSQGDGQIADSEGGTIDLRALLEAMNRRIRFLLNRDMTLGHSFFMPVANFEELREVLLHQVIPLLQEYFYEDWHRIQLVFRDVGPGGEKREPQIICHEGLSEASVLGFDHDDFSDRVEYWVAKPDEITPEAVRKVYEEVA
jgi:hypothetical protein